MVRKLKFHEQKLLKKVDFLEWKRDNPKEQQMTARFHMSNREDYVKYNRICGYITKLASLVSQLPADDPFRARIAEQILDKLFDTGLISNTNTLSQLTRVTAASFCKRRLASILVSLKMAENIKLATTMIEHGHIRVGPDTIRDPAFFITRNIQDFVTWTATSKIKRKIHEYSGTVDDYDMLC